MLRKFVLLAALVSLPCFAEDVLKPLPTDGATTKSTYRCYTTNPPPRCVIVYDDGTTETVEQAVETLDWPSYLAAMRTASSGASTPVLGPGDEGPIAGCGPNHGQSACCKVVARYPLLGIVEIECGRL